jgi:hypothetical protein
MNIAVGLIIATLVISAMIAIRIVAYESALKERLKARRADGACDSAPCFGGCGSDKFESATEPAPDGNRAKRSTPHAS